MPLDKSRGFRLHPVNIVFIAIAFGAGFLNMLATEASGDRTTSYQVGQAFGYGAALCVFAGVFSLFVWLVSRRNSLATNVTFAGVVLLGTFVTVANTLVSSQDNRDLEEYADALRDSIDGGTEETRRVSDEMLGDMIDSSSGDQQQSYIATQKYMNMLLDARTEWETAYDAFMDDRVLDYSLLTEDEEFDYQKTVIKTFAETSKSYAELYESSIDHMREALEETTMNSEQVEEFMVGFADSSRKTNAVTARFLHAHEGAANEYHKLIELLETEAWALDEDTGELLFETDEAIASFETIIDAAMDWEENIETLNAEVERRRQAAMQVNQR